MKKYLDLKFLKFSFILGISMILSTYSFSETTSLIPINKIIAVVNSQIITLKELNDRTKLISKQLIAQNITLPSQNVLENQILQMLINERLIDQTAKRLNITASTQDIQQAITLIAKQQNISPEQFQINLAEQGIPEASFIHQLQEQIIQQKLIEQIIVPQVILLPQEVNAGVQMAQKQIDTEGVQYHLLHILIGVPNSPSPEQINLAEQKALSIVQELRSGADFKTTMVAESNSPDAFSGGDLGFKNASEFPASLQAQLASMKKGDITNPVQSSQGFEIFKLIDTQSNPNLTDPKNLRTQVSQMIFQRKIQEKQQSWLNELRSGAYIKIYSFV